MKKVINNILNSTLILFLIISCSDSENINQELTIQEKIEFLENSEWLSKNGDNEPNVMYTFSEGERFSSYKSEGVWHEGSSTPSADYITEGDLLTMDFYFGHVYTYDIEFSCDNNIIKFFIDGELTDTLFKRNSSYKDCIE